MRRVQAGAAATCNLFHRDFEVCNRYANGLEAAAAGALPGRLSCSARATR